MIDTYERTEPITFEAHSAPEVIETVTIEGKRIAVVRYATLTMARQDSTPEFGRSTDYYAIDADAEVHPLSRSFYVRAGQYHAAGQGIGGQTVARAKGREYARSTTVKAAIQAAQERIERDRLHDQYAPVAMRNIATHTQAAFDALDADAEINPGDLVMVYSHKRYRTGVAIKVYKTRVECLAATPSGSGPNGATRAKGKEVRLLRRATPAAPAGDQAATVEPASEAPTTTPPAIDATPTTDAARALMDPENRCPVCRHETEHRLDVGCTARFYGKRCGCKAVLAEKSTASPADTDPVDAPQWPAGKTLGELDPATRDHFVKQAADRLAAELSHPAMAAAILGPLPDEPAEAGLEAAAPAATEPRTPRGRMAAGLPPAHAPVWEASLAETLADIRRRSRPPAVDVDGRPFGLGALVEYATTPDETMLGVRGRIVEVCDGPDGHPRVTMRTLNGTTTASQPADLFRVVADEDLAEAIKALRYAAEGAEPGPGELTREELLRLFRGYRVEVLLGAATGGVRIDPRRGWVPAVVTGVRRSLAGGVDLWVSVAYPAGVYGRIGERTHREHFDATGRNVRRPRGDGLDCVRMWARTSSEGPEEWCATHRVYEPVLDEPPAGNDDQAATVVAGEGDGMQVEAVVGGHGPGLVSPVEALRRLVAEYGIEPVTLRTVADQIEQSQAGHVTEIQHDGHGRYAWRCQLGDDGETGLDRGEDAYAAATQHGPLWAGSMYVRGPVTVHEGRGDNPAGVPRRMLAGSLRWEPYDGGEWVLASYGNTRDIDGADIAGAQTWAAQMLARGHEYENDEVTVARWEHHRDGYGDWWVPVPR